MVSPNVQNLSPAMYRIATARPIDIIPEIKAYVQLLITKYLSNTNNVSVEDICGLAYENGQITARVLRDIKKIEVNNQDIVTYSSHLIDYIGLDNPLVYMTPDMIDDIKRLVNSVSDIVLRSNDIDTVVGYCHPHTNLNQLWNDYLVTLLFWNDRPWFKCCAEQLIRSDSESDDDGYSGDEDSSSVDDE